MSRFKRIGVGALLAALLAGVAIGVLNYRDEGDAAAPLATVDAASLVARGEYLARAGDCLACHTAVGGEAYAGGRPIATPFGAVFAPNLTPDLQTGIGRWTAADFWRALHNGRSRDGHLLYPAFPYPNYTQVSRQDADALFAFLRSLRPVARNNRAHELRFPYSSPLALAVWRALFFRPGKYTPDSTRSAEWNRGAYLVQGLGHCSACHAERNVLGGYAGAAEFGGGMIPAQHWYAPSLVSPHEGSVAEWNPQDVVSLLKTGVSPKASVIGPMATVVYRSTQFLTDDDLQAIASYLRALPQDAEPWEASRSKMAPALRKGLMARGAKVYDDHCARCHGDQGEGVRGAYPALAGNRALRMGTAVNVVRVVIEGGFPPATAGNPRPFGMPPYATALSSDDLAAVVSYIRGSWGNDAAPVSRADIDQARAVTLD